MKKLALAIWLALVSPALAANVNIDGLPAASSVNGTDLYECEQGGINNRCTPAQLSTYLQTLGVYATLTGIQTLTNKTLTAPNFTAPTLAGNAVSAAGGFTATIFHGTATLGTGAIASGTCASAVPVTAANVATTDVVTAGFSADPTATLGYLPTAMLTIVPYVASAGNIGIKVCNLTGGSITPSAVTLNVSVVR